VLQVWQMGNAPTIRLPEELLAWLEDVSRRTGIPVGRLVREHLETARASKSAKADRPSVRHAGTMSGPPDLSSRKGYSRR